MNSAIAKELEWIPTNTKPLIVSESAYNKSASELDAVLHALTKGNSLNAAKVISRLLNRSSHTFMREAVREEIQADDQEIDAEIVSGVKAFINHHPAKGTRPAGEQLAVDTVVTACTFGLAEGNSVARIAARLGLKNTTKVRQCRKRGSEMLESGEKFGPKKRKLRSDCCRDEARKCVYDFCHTHEGSNVDTESSHTKKVFDQDGKTIVKHPKRVWHDRGLDHRYTAFMNSDAYAAFLALEKGKDDEGKVKPKWKISKEVFRLECCPCCVEPGPESSAATT
jgi:hypothetical protein